MPSPISPFYDRELKAERTAAPLYRAQTERMRAIAEADARRTASEQSFLSKGKSSTSVPAPSEVPHLPERHEKGRLGDIMRASPRELQNIYERMPEEERPVHMIRGTEQSWFSPGTRQEYGDMRTAMTGFRPKTGLEGKEAAEIRKAGALATSRMAEIERQQMGLTKRKQMEIGGLGKIKTPSPVTWTTGYDRLSDRFFDRDAVGDIIITPENQGMHRIAQKEYVKLQKTKEYKPLDAVNISEDFARNVENRYWEYLDAAERDKDLTMKVQSQFRKKYGYVPERRPR